MKAFDPLSEKFRLNPAYRLQWEEAQQTHVLLYPEGMVRLSDTATEILRRCSEPVTGKELIEELQRDYPDAESLPDDVREFLRHAGQQEWITPTES